MLDWFWLDDDTCIFIVKGNEVARCNDAEFDDTLARLLCKYRRKFS